MTKVSKIWVALACLTVAFFVAATTVVLNDGFGAGDLWVFLFWSVPFAAILAGFSDLLIKLFIRLPLLIRLVVASIIGALAGFLWTVIVAIFLGAWFGAFSFPVLSCWVAGGASSIVIAAGISQKRRSKSFIAQSVFVIAICLLALAGTKPFFVWITNDQNLRVINFRLIPSFEPLFIEDDFSDHYRLSEEDLNQLRSIGLTGRLEFTSGGAYGRGSKEAQAIIIMQRQLIRPIELAQPNNVRVVYVQDREGGWRMYPLGAPSLDRRIFLEIPSYNPDVTSQMVELAGGARQGGDSHSWR